MSHKIPEQERVNRILSALKTRPMNYKQLGFAVGFLYLHRLVAELKAQRMIYHNDTDKVLELWK